MLQFFLIGCGLGVAFTFAFSGTQGGEPTFSFARNLVIVGNTDKCENQCLHVHHWMVAAIVALYTMLVTGVQSKATALVAGFALASSIQEFIIFSDSMRIHEQCFPHCSVDPRDGNAFGAGSGV